MKQKAKEVKTVEEFIDESADKIQKSRCLDEIGFKRFCRVMLELAFIRGCRETYREATEIVWKGGKMNGTVAADKRGS